MATTTGTTRKTTTRKKTGTSASARAKGTPAATAAARRSTAKSADTPTPATVVEDKPVVTGPVLKKPDFVDSVVARTGMKKKDVKPLVEAAMALLGDAIEEGREVSIPELGKVKVNREKDLAAAKVIVCKLRRSKKATQPATDPLANPAD